MALACSAIPSGPRFQDPNQSSRHALRPAPGSSSHRMKKPARPDPNTSHLAGEYFVAAELSKRGWAVAMTIGNAKAIDLFVEKGRRTANIQVKCISLRKHAGWP